MKKNWFVAAVLTVSAVLFISGVVKKFRIEETRNRESKVIAVIPKGTVNMWWEVVHKGAAAAAGERGYQITWTGPETETDREKQIQAVEDAMNKNASAIVLGPNDFTALARSVDKICNAGLPCIIIDSPVDNDRYHAFAATDNYAGGARAAEILAGKMGGKGKVLLVKFVQNSASTEQRAAGFAETLKKKYPAIQIVAEQYTSGTVEDARQKTADMLTKFKDATGIFAVNQPTSVGAYKAIDTQGAAGRVKYVAFDSDPTLLDGIQAGAVDAIIVQDPYQIGFTGVQLAADVLEGKKVEKNVPIPSMEVNAGNLDEMKRRAPEALGL